MATIEEAVYARTVGDAGVAALIGTRCYPLVVPQDAAMPAIAYQRISGAPERSHSGFSGVSETRFQFTCEANSYASAKAVAQALRRCWESFAGTVSNIAIGGAFVENESDGYSEETPAPVVRMDVSIWHNEG